MKIKYFILLFFFISGGIVASAQSSGIDRYFEQYKDDDRFSQINVSSKMFGLFVNFELDDPSEQELVEAISKLKGLKMLIGQDVANVSDLFNQVAKLPAADMDELMSIKDGSAEFKFYISESDGTIKELLMVGKESAQLILLSLVGDMDLQQIAALSQKMNLEGFEHFQNIDK